MIDVMPRIRVIVAEVLAMAPDEIDDTEDFVQRYQADSLNVIEIVARVEKEYQITLPERQAYTVRTLTDLVSSQTV